MKIKQLLGISNKYYVKHFKFVLFAIVLSTTCYSQDNELSWEELQEQFECPKWFAEARFGIWVHWGAQTQPADGGGWYARHMYMEDVGRERWGRDAYEYHNKTYGHPSEFGFKDVINEWKAEKLDTDALLKYFKQCGAQYFVALSCHHDHFDNFNSTYHPWNSVNVGPKRDIIGEFAKSARKYGIPFGVSSHDGPFLNWFLPAFGSDKTGLKKGVPYDGHMTKADGKGKWWEGLDPADLYGLPPEKRTPEYIEEIKQNWKLRHTELIQKYDPDMLWFDGYGFPYGDYGKAVSATLYNKSLREDGKIQTVVVGKIKNDPAIIKDIENGVAPAMLPHTWQSITAINGWFHKEVRPPWHKWQNARTLIEILSDVISKNGNMLLNVDLLPDGTIPVNSKRILDDIGQWVNVNADAIFASKPWKVFGDNLNSSEQYNNDSIANETTDLSTAEKNRKDGHFNMRSTDSPPYAHEEVRFTTKDGLLYVFVLNPEEGVIELPSLGLKSKYEVNKISSIRMIGNNENISFEQDADKLILNVPANKQNKYTTVFEVKGAL